MISDAQTRSEKTREVDAPLPNFLIVGAAKSGTTSLYHFLNQHPDVFLSPARKEGRFFSGIGDGSVYWPAFYHFPLAEDLDAYRGLFETWSGQRAIGDVSPDYLAYSHRAAPNVLEHCGPETRIIAIVREPVSRAWSHYLQNVRRDAEFLSFEKTLEVEAERKAKGWGFQWLYTDTGRFAEKLRPYLDAFEHVKILTQDALSADPESVVSEVFDFLGLAPAPVKPQGRFNAGGAQPDKLAIIAGEHDHRADTLFETLHAELVDKAASTAAAPNPDGVYPPPGETLVYPEMKPETRALLQARFAPQIEALETLSGLDLTAWKAAS